LPHTSKAVRSAERLRLAGGGGPMRNVSGAHAWHEVTRKARQARSCLALLRSMLVKPKNSKSVEIAVSKVFNRFGPENCGAVGGPALFGRNRTGACGERGRYPPQSCDRSDTSLVIRNRMGDGMEQAAPQDVVTPLPEREEAPSAQNAGGVKEVKIADRPSTAALARPTTAVHPMARDRSPDLTPGCQAMRASFGAVPCGPRGVQEGQRALRWFAGSSGRG
jgi:hypothetical protein